MRARQSGFAGIPSGARGRSGFTVPELLVVLLVISVTLSISAQSYGVYLERTAAKRAAQIFAQDLVLARTSALRDRQPVSLRFEAGPDYLIRKQTGETIVRRSYGGLAEVHLSEMTLIQPSGDSIAFSARGVAGLGSGGALGQVRFQAGTITYRVLFNSMGATEVSEQP